MKIELVNELFERGILTDLYKHGFVGFKIFEYRNIFQWVYAQMTTRHITKNQAVIEAGLKYGKNERTIWRALNCFEKKAK